MEGGVKASQRPTPADFWAGFSKMCSCSSHHRASPRQDRGDVQRALRMSARWTEMLDSEAVWPRNQGNGGALLLGGDPWRLPSHQQPRAPVVSRLCVRAPLRSCRGAGGPSPGSSAPPTLKARVLVLTLLPPPPPGPIHPTPLLPRTSEHLTWTPLPTYLRECPGAVVTSDHTSGGLEQHRSLYSQVWRPEARW